MPMMQIMSWEIRLSVCSIQPLKCEYHCITPQSWKFSSIFCVLHNAILHWISYSSAFTLIYQIQARILIYASLLWFRFIYSTNCYVFIWIRSEHEANTERMVTKSTSMRHQEGGWPRDVDFSEQTGRCIYIYSSITTFHFHFSRHHHQTSNKDLPTLLFFFSCLYIYFF